MPYSLQSQVLFICVIVCCKKREKMGFFFSTSGEALDSCLLSGGASAPTAKSFVSVG